MLTDKMRTAFGYDAFGNSDRLLAETDRVAIEAGVPRAGGMVVCDVCLCTYNNHPPVQGALWLTRTCNAGLVKL